MVEISQEYQAYVVRIWPVRDEEGVIWHALITNAHTGETRGFAGLEDLFVYLREQTTRVPSTR